MAPTKKSTDDVPAATAPIPAHVVGNAFVQHYYHILHTSPNEIYKFCKKKIMEADTSAVKTVTDIDTVDSHLTPGGGIIVLVKGRATVGGQSRGFSQSFLLATQVPGYYVLEDTLRYVG